jgi:hypothetical protein
MKYHEILSFIRKVVILFVQKLFRRKQFMAQKKTIDLSDIKNEKEREVLNLLHLRGKCLYGNIFKELSISSREGQHIIFSLLSRGLIKYRYGSSVIELNVNIR